MLFHQPPDTHCDPTLKAIFHRNAGTIRPAPGRRALLLIGVAIPKEAQIAALGLMRPPIGIHALQSRGTLDANADENFCLSFTFTCTVDPFLSNCQAAKMNLLTGAEDVDP